MQELFFIILLENVDVFKGQKSFNKWNYNFCGKYGHYVNKELKGLSERLKHRLPIIWQTGKNGQK